MAAGQLTGRLQKAVIIGDSHVYWLNRFLDSAGPSWVWPGVSADFAVDGHGFKVEYVGRRGATVRSLQSEEHWERFALLRPQLVLLHAGSNDVSSGGSPQQIAWELLDFATDLVASGVGHVVIGQLIRRKNWRDLTAIEGAARTVMVNEVIRAECQQCHQVSFWKHKGFLNSQEPIFRSDGVHFNDLGSYKLFRSYRGAILRAAKWL